MKDIGHLVSVTFFLRHSVDLKFITHFLERINLPMTFLDKLVDKFIKQKDDDQQQPHLSQVTPDPVISAQTHNFKLRP